MESTLSAPLLAAFAAVLAIGILKALFLGTATAVVRGRLLKFINPEDAAWLGGEALQADAPGPARIARAHRNELENLLPFFIAGSMFLAAGAHPTAGLAYCAAFLLGRSGHTYAYLRQRAALRRHSYSLAWLATVAMTLHAGAAMIGNTM